MQKSLATLDRGTTCSSWNYCAQRLATGSIDGTLSVFESSDPFSSCFSCCYRNRVGQVSISKVIWIPPEYGDAVACVFVDGSFSLWEEVVEDEQLLQWKLCKCFPSKQSRVLDVQFGFLKTNLGMVAAYANGHVKVYELLGSLELKTWHLQADFQNILVSISSSLEKILGSSSSFSSSISWKPHRGENQESSFVVGFGCGSTALNSAKVWEFDQAHQRWLPVAELASPGDQEDEVSAVAWAPNIGRPYEVIAVATDKGISMWHLGLRPEPDGLLSLQKVGHLSNHDCKVWQMEWDMSGMTLATTGSDGMVRLWQSNLNGTWLAQAVLQPTSQWLIA